LKTKRVNFGKIGRGVDLPYLVEVQHASFNKFVQWEYNDRPEERPNIGLQAIFNEVFPIEDVHGRYELQFEYFKLEPPRYSPDEARLKDLSYAAPLKVRLNLIEYDIEIKELKKDKDIEDILKKIKEVAKAKKEGKPVNLFYKLGDDIKDPEKGIVFFKKGEDLTEEVIQKFRDLGLKSLSVMVKSVKNTIPQDVYLGELPLMTEEGNFIINGVDRILVNQLHRSPGVFFDEVDLQEGRSSYTAEIIPYRGPWITFSIELNETLMVSLDGKRKFPVTILLKALGYDSREKIFKLLFDVRKVNIPEKNLNVSELVGKYTGSDVVNPETGEVIFPAGTRLDHEKLEELYVKGVREVEIIFSKKDDTPVYIANCFSRDKTESYEDAIRKIYHYLRGTFPPSLEAARENFHLSYFDQKRFDLSPVGRKKINSKLGLDIPEDRLSLTPTDFIETVRYLLRVVEGEGEIDDIDHLGNRRVRGVGEMLENQFRIALTRLSNTVKERMMVKDEETITPQEVINMRQVSSVINSFFATNQLSQYMDQTNPLSELTHKRRLSALGIGGLTRETAGFEVRDVHYTHYGRICPIETPEGENIGLMTSLATYAKVNKDGFIETPYRKVKNGKVTNEIVYLDATEEDKYTIAQANINIGKNGEILDEYVLARRKGGFPIVKKDEVDFVDLTPMQMVSVSASLIPFLEHDDANRALMGSNMQRQAVPLLAPEAPIVGTGNEEKVARDSGAVVVAKRSGTVVKVSATEIWIKPDEKLTVDPYDVYELKKFKRTSQNTCMNQRPLVKVGDKVKKGDIIADGPATDKGELALGHNVLIAFLPYFGWNYEDAIVISERLLKEDIFTSFHIEELDCEVRDTKLGPEEITNEIPNVSESAVRNLDENGIVRIGAEVNPGDILVGKVSPKGETELTPEEKLLRAIFGEKASDVKDSSLRVPPGLSGTVVDVVVLSREPKKDQIQKLKKEKEEKLKELKNKKKALIKEVLLGKKISVDVKNKKDKVIIKKGTTITEKHLKDIDKWANISDIAKAYPKLGSLLQEINVMIAFTEKQMENRIHIAEKGDELPPGIIKKVKVFIGQRRKISIGDKLSGRHGNKGVVSVIVPEEDMPYLEDGTPVDIVLNPLGVPSRMNVGQVLEAHLGWAAKELGIKVATPVFDGATIEEVRDYLEKAGLPTDGKVTLYDGRTGEPFKSKVTVGYMYIMKLIHMVDDKVHARATGPYSLITQQPLGGKAQFGGQRFGEMEVWALEGYGAAHTLQEMLTVKSDDIQGRHRMYEAIVKGDNPPEPGLPASFNVLLRELNGLGLNVELIKKGGKE